MYVTGYFYSSMKEWMDGDMCNSLLSSLHQALVSACDVHNSCKQASGSIGTLKAVMIASIDTNILLFV